MNTTTTISVTVTEANQATEAQAAPSPQPKTPSVYIEVTDKTEIEDDSVCHFEVIEEIKGQQHRVYSGVYDAERELFIVARYGKKSFDLIPLAAVSRYLVIDEVFATL